MIIYFSATGNCKYIAEKIAYETNDISISMQEIGKVIKLKDNENLGIITPTYFWRLPTYVEEVLNNIQINNASKAYIYCIATYGTTSGQTDYYIKKILKKKKLILSASYNIKTVDNWTVMFDLTNKDEINNILLSEKEQVENIVELIKNKETIFINKDKKPLFLCNGAKKYYDKARKTSHLHVDDNCINCGLCVKNCPMNAIEIKEKIPIWLKEDCTMCFGCLHNCPTFAIQYDDKTKKNGQYIHPPFKKFKEKIYEKNI